MVSTSGLLLLRSALGKIILLVGFVSSTTGCSARDLIHKYKLNPN